MTSYLVRSYQQSFLYRTPGGFVKIVIARHDSGALGGRVPAHTLSPCLVDSHHGGVELIPLDRLPGLG